MTYMNQFWQFLAERYWERTKETIKRHFIFPPHLTGDSALLCKTGIWEIASFDLNR